MTQRLIVRGGSMRPFLVDGDEVTVAGMPAAARFGDVVAYITSQAGRPLVAVHRMRTGWWWPVDDEPGTLRLVAKVRGDASPHEEIVPATAFLGRVVAVNGRSVDTRAHRFIGRWIARTDYTVRLAEVLDTRAAAPLRKLLKRAWSLAR